MKHFTKYSDVPNADALISSAIEAKKNGNNPALQGKQVCLMFFNPSLRTRLSTEVAAKQLGADVTVVNGSADSWTMEFADGAVMNGNTTEHIKDAINVICQYYDLIGVRAFASLEDVDIDYNEPMLSAFLNYSTVPVVSLESATRHPLQSLADMITIREHAPNEPKIAITWAPHPKALPQAVVNSFLEWVPAVSNNVVLACPLGYEPHPDFVGNIPVTHNQNEALQDVDIVYCKNWSSYTQYGQTPKVTGDWMVSGDKMALSNNGKFMHCMPIRRNVIATDEVIDQSIIYKQAENRLHAAKHVLKELLS